VTPYFGDIP